MHSFHSGLIDKAAILDCDRRPSDLRFQEDELEKADFWAVMDQCCACTSIFSWWCHAVPTWADCVRACVCVSSFGEQVQLLHPFQQQFNDESGARVLRLCQFQQKKTRIAQVCNFLSSCLQGTLLFFFFHFSRLVCDRVICKPKPSLIGFLKTYLYSSFNIYFFYSLTPRVLDFFLIHVISSEEINKSQISLFFWKLKVF